jgi:glyoxalase-like protein
MNLRFDHAVVVVSSLVEATREFARAGFTVLPGGRHDALPTENALVCFADGSYLELLATRDPATRGELRALRASDGWERHLRGVSAVARRFLPRLAGADGVADWVLHADSLAGPAARLRAQGIAASGPVRMSRERPDGEKLEWELLLPESPLHPFWIADRTPRERRVPGDAPSTRHANGARGVSVVFVGAAVVPVAALALGDMLDVRPALLEGGVSVLEFGGWRAELVELVAEEPEGACAITLTGCGQLPTELEALGVTTEAGS